MDEVSPRAAIARLRAPVLLIRGYRDRHVPLRHARALREAAPERCELWVVPRGTHVNLREAGGAERVRRVREFFLAHL